jgi:hypothetical protein
MGLTLFQVGRFSFFKNAANRRSLCKLPHDALPEIELVRDDPYRGSLYAIAYHALGRKKESDAALSKLITKYNARMAYQIAEVHAFRNQSDEAF